MISKSIPEEHTTKRLAERQSYIGFPNFPFSTSLLVSCSLATSNMLDVNDYPVFTLL